jgi:beta-mannosidase
VRFVGAPVFGCVVVRTQTTPNGGFLLETHGPYQHGEGFPAVNGNAHNSGVSAGMNGGCPIKLTGKSDGTVVGLGQKNIFASEFGSSVYSSFESMSPTIAPEHWGIHGGAPPDNCQGGFASKCQGNNVMAQRNYPCDNIIDTYFGPSDFDKVGEKEFKQQLWQCMVGQALLIKSDIETRRAGNQFGIIVWQYNEIWPTGGWGSIEYGTVGYTKGQVLGGRWKPLHHWYKKTIYADVMSTCGDNGAGGMVCYVKNDSPKPFKGTVDVSLVTFATGATKSMKKLTLDMPAGAGTTQWFTVGSSLSDAAHADAQSLLRSPQDSMVQVTVSDATDAVVCDNPVLFAEPKNLTLPKASVSAVVGAAGADGSVEVTVTTDKFALFVTLTTLAQGRFSDNAFAMLPGKKTLKFFPFQGFELSELKATLRIEHTATYM